MSTANNLDNDPFPVFTPRSSIQQQLGRSPIQQINNNSNMLMQSPYSSTRFGLNQQQQQQQQSMIGLLRSPSIPNQPNLRHNQYNSSQANDQRQLIANMVQNLSLNNQASTQPSLITKLQTPSSTPPPPSSQQSTSMLPPLQPVSHSNNSSTAHRKLFTSQIDTNSADMMVMNGGVDVYHPHHMMNASQQPPQLIQTQDLMVEPSRTIPPDLANVAHLKRSDSYFMSEELRTEILRKNLLMLSIPNQEPAIPVPAQVKDYHNLVPLDNQQINIDHKSRTFSYQTISYKATHIKTNAFYYLKRICGFRYINQRCIEIVETWKKIHHANICTLRDVFGTKEFNGDHSLVFVYDYYPGLETLQYRLYNNPNINLKGWANPYNIDGAARPFSAGKTINGSRSLGLLPEQNVWDFVIQLSSIIRAIHSVNLACRIITPSRILVDHKSRLRLSGVGIFDVIDFDNSINMVAQYQQEDLLEFGRLIIALACNSLIAVQKEHINTSLEIISRSYSADLRNLISHFMTPPNQATTRKSINDVMPLIGPRFYTSLDNAYTRGDVIENELSKEIENSRLFRLITKMNIVLERQDTIGDIQWTETGDRYMLKLFRDYVFHQVSPTGQPWIDLSHIIQCLNKFDTGSNEKICLVSPDGQNIMIVSYAQLKKCFEKVFNEVNALMNS